ncbi:adenylate/guanylate cyclase domain-containing protein [Antrihabitans cavernicola]|uniref:Adenylate/guanylate cyclase domain-containing protein n=2 Tax=Antrihabitans cavernicola TaxID=2495913 RepID=A0A5A7S6N7_9NOCA|nr:adenylate/guanylate cyclase domain-containing protein [Spelaeibacter cavernicola]
MRARYSAALITAYGIGAAELVVIVVLLGRSDAPDAHSLVTVRNALAMILMLLAGLAIAAVFTTKFVMPSLRWFCRGEEPTPAQRHNALEITSRQTKVHVSMWVCAGTVFFFANVHSGGRNLALIVLAVIFGGAAMLCMGTLITDAILRPMIIASMTANPPSRRSPGVMERLVVTWALCTAIPVSAVIAIMVDRYLLWVIHSDTPIGGPILILGVTAIIAGVSGTVLVSRTVSVPVREVGLAMAEVERGHTDVSVSVHDSSEIGRLQMGFNRMAAEVAERERLRDLFGRHVGHDVASRAIEQEEMLGGDVRTVAVLFIDLAGSTAFAATRPPDEVAALLNDFFRIVVTAVDEHHGLINKFGGDAALAIFGAPLAIDDPAGAALATARELRSALRELRSVDFGIGVSYGSVFAGNIGAEERYEYTVIGDPVNEAARLTERAKDRPARILAAEQVLVNASDSEAKQWRSRGRTVLRGRTRRTIYAEPIKTP